MTLIVDRQDQGQWGVATATFDQDRIYRYSLTRVWDAALPMTAFVMLNPSTADAFVVDPTVRRCLGFAQDWGSGGLLVLNAFGLRSTDPKALYGHPDPVGPKNDTLIMQALALTQPAQVIVGWGHHAGRLDSTGGRRPPAGRRGSPGRRNHVNWTSREGDLRRLLGDRVLTLKTTKDGHPGHPLYVRGDTIPQSWKPS